MKNTLPFIIAEVSSNIRSVIKEELEAEKKSNEDDPKDQSTGEGLEKVRCPYKDFLACNPNPFLGAANPIVIQRWITEMEGAFDTSHCAPKDKVIYASNSLRGRARDWWEVLKKERGHAGIMKMTWEEFKVIFLKHFCPQASVERIADEFLHMTQTYQTVEEITGDYFDKLQFCPFMEDVKMRINRYHRMLKTDIREFINPSKCETLEEIINWAQERETELNRQKASGEKRKIETFSTPSKKLKTNFSKKTESHMGTHHCNTCGKNHPGECRLKQNICYRCGRVGHTSPQCSSPVNECYYCNMPGHIKSECPKLRGGEGKGVDIRQTRATGGDKKGETSGVRGRAFQITAEEAKVTLDVVTGIFFINSMPAHVLFDSRASYSFVSMKFSKDFTHPTTKLINPLEIEITDSKIFLVLDVHPNCRLEVEGEVYSIDLIPMILGEFDAVIGMDWLSRHHAEIICHQKIIHLSAPSGRRISIYGEKKGNLSICSIMKAKKYLNHGCKAFLAYVVDTSQVEIKIENVPVVNEFLDVFPNVLPGIPPEREVEFRIDLVADAKPIAKAPYRLAPTEMQEFMSQLQDLLDKGFILDPVKVEAKTPTEFRSFLGLAGYYRRFIKDFSKIASPLTKLTRKDIKFNWGSEHDEAFKILKKKLTQAPVLVLPEGTEDLVRGKVIAYASRQLKPNELNYPTHDLELAEVIKEAQTEALKEENLKQERIVGHVKDLNENKNGVKIRYGRIWIPNTCDVKILLLDEAHKSKYSIHPGATKMYHDLRGDYWWPGMKREIVKYVERCLTCLQVKAEHQKPYGKIQPLEIPKWKWEHITMDLVTKLPKTSKGFDAIWVIVDRLTKSSHFLPIQESYSSERMAEVYMKEVVSRHGVPVSIVSDRDTRFTSRFCRKLQEELGTRLLISTTYHPQTDGQSERTIQTFEDMLRACIIDFGGSWEKYLSLPEFSYNNSYHSSIGMLPYEMLYGRKCRTPICWGRGWSTGAW
ncbi:uncharacterized protein LOC143543926 [Bidens hawaiensis]|uniref:uncharacterized protein LOC143543926 n=1 Tax=Bidens hawaiensis TaxID=980011 RepID=UPI00404A8110